MTSRVLSRASVRRSATLCFEGEAVADPAIVGRDAVMVGVPTEQCYCRTRNLPAESAVFCCPFQGLLHYVSFGNTNGRTKGCTRHWREPRHRAGGLPAAGASRRSGNPWVPR